MENPLRCCLCKYLGRSIISDSVQQEVIDLGCAADEAGGGLILDGVAVPVRADAAALFEHQCGCRIVPGLDAPLKVAVDLACCHISDGQGRGTDPPDIQAVSENLFGDGKTLFGVLLFGRAGTEFDQTAFQLPIGGDAQLFTVEISAFSGLCHEQVFVKGIVDHAEVDLFSVKVSQGHGAHIVAVH